jgi:CRISPR-associated protein Cas6
MADDSDNAVDIAFNLEGKSLPADYSFALMQAVARLLPWIESEPAAGIHPLRAAKTDANDLLLPRRAKLVLRLPERRAQEAMALCGRELTVCGHRLKVGAAGMRRLLPYATLHAHFVTAGSQDELDFLKDIGVRLQALRTPCEVVCGKRRMLRAGETEIAGFSLMLHGLGLEHSILVQRIGLGDRRLLGCGIFVGHKSVAAVG